MDSLIYMRLKEIEHTVWYMFCIILSFLSTNVYLTGVLLVAGASFLYFWYQARKETNALLKFMNTLEKGLREEITNQLIKDDEDGGDDVPKH